MNLFSITFALSLFSVAFIQADNLKIVKIAPNHHGMLCRSQNKNILFLRGTPKQMGVAHGQLLPEQIKMIEEKALYVVGGIYSVGKNDWFFSRIDEAKRRAMPHTPERFVEECDAIAKTVGLNKEDFRSANFFPEMFHCSGFAVRGEASKNGRVLHARVLDYMMDIGLQEIALVTVFMPDDFNNWVSVGYAGFIGTVTAMNEKGLAIGEMGGRGEGDWDGCPMTFLLRDIMERADNVEQALDIMKKTPRTCEYYYVISDKDANLAAVYATPENLEVLRPGEQHPRLPPVPKDTVMISVGNRAKALSERLREKHGKIDVETMIEIIKRPVAMRSNLHDAVFAPETLDFWCADAGKKQPACDRPYAHFNLDKLIAFYDENQKTTSFKKVQNQQTQKK